MDGGMEYGMDGGMEYGMDGGMEYGMKQSLNTAACTMTSNSIS